MKPNIIEIKINLDHLLWRTRNKDQDYQFIKTPKSPSLDGWFSFFSKVFSNREPSRNPKNFIGKFESFHFVATCFIDDKYLDLSGRPIKQYLIWFLCGDYDISEIKESLANDWGKDFVSTSKGLYQPFHELSDTAKLDKENYIIIERSSDNYEKLQYSDIGEMKRESPVRKPISSQPTNRKIKKELEETFEEAIGNAIIEGEKWVYKNKKNVNSKQSNKDSKGFPQCLALARSFGGSTKDQFIKRIAENPKVHWYSPILKSPQKGFDSIVNAFVTYKKHKILLDLDENEGRKFVSECIKGDALADDECIRNIYSRLRELAKQDKGK